MIFVFGGAYQGKTDFVKEKFGVTDDDICAVGSEIDFGCKVLKLDSFFRYLLDNNIQPSEYVQENIELFEDKIICMTDISCGVVSIDGKVRELREEVSRCMVVFAKRSKEVYRVYCGIPVKIK